MNFRYGVFLAGTNKSRSEAIPLLEKAKTLGIVGAEYTLGLTYLSLGDKVEAVENLKVTPHVCLVTKILPARWTPF